MLFLTKGASTRRAMFWFALALCCLSDALAAKITRKAKPEAVESTKDEVNATKATAAAETNATAVVIANSADASDVDDDDDDDDEDDDDVAAAAADDDDDDSAEKQTVEAAAADANATNSEVQGLSATSVWNTVTGLWNWLRSDLSESLFADDADDDGDNDGPTKSRTARSLDAAVASRTFGKIRRLQMALIPIIFKFGILSAMVAFLVAISMKSLFLLKVLVFMNAIAILGKFLTFKSGLVQLEHSAPPFSYHGWNPHVREGWAPTAPAEAAPHHPSKEIHLHIHGSQAQVAPPQVPQGHTYETQAWQSRSDPYGGYLPLGNVQVADERNDASNIANPFDALPTKYAQQHVTY